MKIEKIEKIAEKVNKRYPHLRAAYTVNPAYWAWACIYNTRACEYLNAAEVQSIINLSDNYASGRSAY